MDIQMPEWLGPLFIGSVLTYLLGFMNRNSEARNRMADKKLDVANRLAFVYIRMADLRERSKTLAESIQHLEARNQGRVEEAREELRLILRSQEALAERSSEEMLQYNLYLSGRIFEPAQHFMKNPRNEDGYMRYLKGRKARGCGYTWFMDQACDLRLHRLDLAVLLKGKTPALFRRGAVGVRTV